MKASRTIKLIAALALAGLVLGGCAGDDTGSDEQHATENSPRPKFSVFEGSDGQYYFNLKAANGEIILQSEGYVAKASAQNGIESCKTNGVDLDNFEILEASDGQFYFNLKAQNHQVIGTSELYVSKSNAERGSETVRENIAKVLRLEAAETGGARFEIFVGKDDQFYFHMKAANGEIVLQSEGYVAKASADNGIASVRENGRDLDNFEILEASDGQFYFNLKAQNHQVIGTSELYVSKSNAEHGAETVQGLLYSERVADAGAVVAVETGEEPAPNQQTGAQD